jgi:hypothetical protein
MHHLGRPSQTVQVAQGQQHRHSSVRCGGGGAAIAAQHRPSVSCTTSGGLAAQRQMKWGSRSSTGIVVSCTASQNVASGGVVVGQEEQHSTGIELSRNPSGGLVGQSGWGRGGVG